MQNLDQNRELTDNGQLEELSLLNPSSDVLDTTSEMLTKSEKLRENVQIIENCKKEVDAVKDEVENLVTQEGKLIESPDYKLDYRQWLGEDLWKLTGYSNQMWDFIMSYNKLIHDLDLWTVKANQINMDRINTNVETCQWYLDEAKKINLGLAQKKREIELLVRLQAADGSTITGSAEVTQVSQSGETTPAKTPSSQQEQPVSEPIVAEDEWSQPWTPAVEKPVDQQDDTRVQKENKAKEKKPGRVPDLSEIIRGL